MKSKKAPLKFFDGVNPSQQKGWICEYSEKRYGVKENCPFDAAAEFTFDIKLYKAVIDAKDWNNEIFSKEKETIFAKVCKFPLRLIIKQTKYKIKRFVSKQSNHVKERVLMHPESSATPFAESRSLSPAGPPSSSDDEKG